MKRRRAPAAGRVATLVLNASGGLERDLIAADPEYPMRINRDAQLAALDALLPLLRAGATVIHVTSHWAHLYGTVSQLPEYEPVARSNTPGRRPFAPGSTTSPSGTSGSSS